MLYCWKSSPRSKTLEINSLLKVKQVVFPTDSCYEDRKLVKIFVISVVDHPELITKEILTGMCLKDSPPEIKGYCL